MNKRRIIQKSKLDCSDAKLAARVAPAVEIPGINSVGKQFLQKQAESQHLQENPFH